jgi:predicted amidophosphoribosyltransferase
MAQQQEICPKCKKKGQREIELNLEGRCWQCGYESVQERPGVHSGRPTERVRMRQVWRGEVRIERRRRRDMFNE